MPSANKFNMGNAHVIAAVRLYSKSEKEVLALGHEQGQVMADSGSFSPWSTGLALHDWGQLRFFRPSGSRG
ncbi:hypothetical protein SUGI_1206050 [Cryptomeria japonica]|nr:hypothetical protein SUGI_1206050 [Cryptomeria japonica]